VSNQIRTLKRTHQRNVEQAEKIKLRKMLNADALIAQIHSGFKKITDHRSSSVKHSLADTLMAGFAMFVVKRPFAIGF